MGDRLAGKTALVTGASRGIGASVAKAFAREGARVVLLARTTGALEALDDEIRAMGAPAATIVPLDLSDLESVDRLGPLLFERLGSLDILVANAAMLGTLGPLAHTDPALWQKVMDVNLNANFRLIRTLDPLFRRAPAGRVIFVSSGIAVTPKAYWGAYAASKAGLEALAAVYAAECEQTNIRVSVVDPGRVRTSMRAQAYPGEDPQTRPHPDDIVAPFVDMCTENAPTEKKIVLGG